MGKLTLEKLNSVELSDRLVKTIDSIKGGLEEHCHNGHSKSGCGMSCTSNSNCGGQFE